MIGVLDHRQEFCKGMLTGSQSKGHGNGDSALRQEVSRDGSMLKSVIATTL
jgi:hypothetical protein